MLTNINKDNAEIKRPINNKTRNVMVFIELFFTELDANRKGYALWHQ